MVEVHGTLVVHDSCLVNLHPCVLHCLPVRIFWLPSWGGFRFGSMCIQLYGKQISSIGSDKEKMGGIH